MTQTLDFLLRMREPLQSQICQTRAVLSDNQYGTQPVTYPSIAGNIRQKPGFSGFYSPEKSGFCGVSVAIDTAAHKTKLNDPSITNYGDIIALQNQRGNTISYEEDTDSVLSRNFQSFESSTATLYRD